MADKNCMRSTCNLREKISAPEIAGNQIYDVEVMPVIIEKSIVNSKVVFEGEVRIKIYVCNNPSRWLSCKRNEITI